MKKSKFLCLCAMMLMLSLPAFSKKKIDVLYLTGHTDRHHSWEILSTYQLALLEEAAIFDVDVIQLPKVAEDDTRIDFKAYDVVVFNMNEVVWPQSLKQSFEKYMRRGGGLVVVHESDNAFPEWPAFNQMIALAGWGNRTESAGPYCYWKDDALYVDSQTPGTAGKHGKRVPFVIHLRQPEHPIVKGLPSSWLHVNDELYGDLRGPAQHMDILATAFSETESGGTGKEEPVLFTVRYKRGRIFHCVLGHTKKNFDASLKNLGYQIVFQRGTEWAATGKVSLPLPECHLSVEEASVRSLEEINKK